MDDVSKTDLARFFSMHHPFDLLPETARANLVRRVNRLTIGAGADLVLAGQKLRSVFIVESGELDAISPEGEAIARYVAGDCIGVRALFRDGEATARVAANEPSRVLEIPAGEFRDLVAGFPAVGAFFERVKGLGKRMADSATEADVSVSIVSASIRENMARPPIMVTPDTPVRDAARTMRDHGISCVLVGSEEALAGILTAGDITDRLVAEGLSADTPVSAVMTGEPLTLEPDGVLFDALLLMSERGIGHLPVTERGRPVGIVTRTNLVRRQSISAIHLIGDISRHEKIEDLAATVARIPQLLAQLVGAGIDGYRVGHVITSIADALTRRLLALGEARLGEPPVPYLWAACGSQGRREQTGVSDQDNCIILDPAYDAAAHGPYFKALATFVCDGLDRCGYFYCPGDMMATNDQWRQPIDVWRRYFQGWIAKPDPMAQMLSSVMFDLRPISGRAELFEGLQAETLELAARNSIFRAHMISNSLKHVPPLGLFRGFALIRSGEHKNTVDLKHNGIVPIVDLGRVYALMARVEQVNTRDRLAAAIEAGSLSESGGTDLIDAYDLICDVRLEHQARQVRNGEKPDNFMMPNALSALERNHLRDAFGVIKTLQSALSSRGALS